MIAKKVSNEKQFVLDYLNRIGLKASKTHRQFWRQLDSRHEKGIIDQLSKAMDERYEGKSDAKTVYAIKNQNLRLSLDVANFSADLYRRYFDWFVKHKEKSPQMVLDLGCDNGIVTCFYAMLFPESEIVGIDILVGAINCANDLARMLELSNVTFLQSDLREIKNHFPNSSFDLITSLRSFHEIIGDFPDELRYWSINELLKTDQHFHGGDLLLIVKDLLSNETSEFISCERLPWLGSLAIWAKTLENSGLYINWDKSDYISFHELEDEQRMPLLTTSKQSSDSNLLEHIYALETKSSDIYIEPNHHYREALAEAVLTR